MSGVGKSTLVNALLGRQAQETGEVRDADGRGRHTTTHRELFMMASGALLIDTPGMRELAPWKAEEAASFDDVEALAAACRFSDCRHASEPGCAIQQALETGALSPERWTRYEQHQVRRVEQVAGARPEGEEHARHRRGRRRG
jgi:ribosome biogenesis GTPase